MSFFVDPSERVAIHDDETAENVVWIKAKMDRRTRAAVQDDLLKLQIDARQVGRSGADEEGAEGAAPTITATVGVETQKLTLLIHNVVRWEGPGFVDARGRAIPCTRQRIEQLDPDIPFFEKVVGEIERRNLPRTQHPRAEVTDPNASELPASAT